MDDVLLKLEEMLNDNKQAAVAVVIKKTGSALRQTGAKMVLGADGKIFGSVSGGCVESAVAEEAMACIRDGSNKLLHYGISDDTAWSVGLMCGGEIDIFVHPVKPVSESGIDLVVVEKLIDLQQRRVPYAFLNFLDGKQVGQTCIVELHDGLLDPISAAWADKELLEQVWQVLDNGASQVIESSHGKIFADVHKPSPRLVIIGAAHISRALVSQAKLLDYTNIVIDPRTAFATKERFPDVDEMLTIWPVEAMDKIGLTKEDYVLLLSHDDKLDLPAAGRAIETQVRYIGMLSSRTTRDRRFQLLKEEGYSENSIKKIHAPIGLEIGARSPEEIALSVLAEVTAFRYGKLN